MHIGTANLGAKTSSIRIITKEVMKLYEKIMEKSFSARRINITANNVIREEVLVKTHEQINLFTDYKQKEKLEGEKNLQDAIIGIRKKYGKNSIIKAMDLQEGATAIDRNKQIGGHKE